jgi:hypothetical protein
VRVRVHKGDKVSGGSHETARMLAHFSPYVAALAALAGLKNRALTHFQTAPLGVRATDSRKPGSALVVSLGRPLAMSASLLDLSSGNIVS